MFQASLSSVTVLSPYTTSGPGSVSEDGRAAAVGADAVNRKVVAAHHEIHVDDGVVDAARFCLGCREIIAVRQDFLEARAEGDMAAGILVKERLVKQKTAAVDRALLRNQGDLAKHGGALVHGNHLFEQLLAALGLAG